MKFSPITIERFRSARHQGFDFQPCVLGLAGNIESGIFILLALRCDDNRVIEARFRSFNCISAVAAGDWVCERVAGQSLECAMEIDTDAVDLALGGLPPSRKFCAGLAETALHAALSKAQSKGILT